MSLLEITNLSHSFMEKILYEGASFDLYKGEHIGVIGQNGVGKRTLMNFNASIILVCHEESFYKGLADSFLNIEDFFT